MFALLIMDYFNGFIYAEMFARLVFISASISLRFFLADSLHFVLNPRTARIGGAWGISRLFLSHLPLSLSIPHQSNEVILTKLYS